VLYYGQVEHYAIWTIWFGDGTGFSPSPTRFGACHESSYPSGQDCNEWMWEFTSAYSPVSNNRLYVNQDFNGDGLADHVVSNAGNAIFLNEGPVEDLLTAASSPLGGSISFEYSSSGEMRADPNTPSPANPGMPFSRLVVERTTVSSDPNSAQEVTEYHYEGGVYDSTTRDFYGYALVERTELFDGGAGAPAGTTVTSSYEVDTACAGRSTAIDASYGAARLRSVQRSYLRASGPAGADTLATWHACLLESSTTIADEELGSGAMAPRARRVEYQYGADPAASFYNVEQIDELGEVNPSTFADIAGDERAIQLEYTAANTALNLVSLVSERWVEDPASPTTKHAHVRLYYDGLALGAAPTAGRLTAEERWYENTLSDPNATPGWVSMRQVGYDAFGNPTSLDDAPHELSGGGSARAGVAIAYDSTYATFPVTRIQRSDAPGAPELTTTLAYSGCASALDPPPGLGLPCSVTSPGGQVVSRGYDALGRVAEIQHPSGLLETRTYALPSPTGPTETELATTLDDPNGAVLTSTVLLDGLGRQIQVERPGKVGETVRVLSTYDDRGLLLSETLPHYTETSPLYRTFTWDPLGRPSAVVDADGETRRTSIYDPWQVANEAYFGTESPANRQERTERSFDAYGRLAAVTNYEDAENLSDALMVTAHYDLLHQLVRVDDPIQNSAACPESTYCPTQIHQTHLAYDTLGRRVWIDDPDSGEWLFRYDASGRLAARTDARGEVNAIAYDALGRMASRSFDSTTASFSYDDNPNSPDFGRLLDVDQDTPAVSYTYAYDSAGRVDHLEQVTNGLRFTNDYTYDAFGRVAFRTYPDGEVYRHVYDGTRLVAIEKENSGGFDMFLSAEYDAFGRMTELEVGRTNTQAPNSPAATLKRQFDPANARLTGMQAIGRGKASQPNLDLTFQFDGLGRLEQMGGSYEATAIGARSFTYDGLGRLETATGPWEKPQGTSGAVTWTYGYDVLGNLRTQTSDSADPNTAYSRTWTYADADRPRFLTEFKELEGGVAVATDVMIPDAAGNTARINGDGLIWNGLGLLKMRRHHANGLNYYDWSGRRVMRYWAATRLIYVGDDFEYDTGLGMSTKFFFLNGERVATRGYLYTAQSAWIPPMAYRFIVDPLRPAVLPTLLALIALGLLALLLTGLGAPLPAWAAAPGMALLAAALVLYPTSAAFAVIGTSGGPEWHGGHSRGLLIYGNDHLGSTRVVIDAAGETVETRDYAPRRSGSRSSTQAASTSSTASRARHGTTAASTCTTMGRECTSPGGGGSSRPTN
jgi:YD repeat-containing protein